MKEEEFVTAGKNWPAGGISSCHLLPLSLSSSISFLLSILTVACNG